MASLEHMEDGFPSEIQDKLTEFDESVTKIDDALQALHSVPLAQTQSQLSALDKAKLELIGAYTVNSLFWMYLNTQGLNPKEHAVKQEIDRVRGYMNRVRLIQDKEKAPVINVPAAKKFVRNALWAKAHQQTDVNKEKGAEKSSSVSGEPASKHIRFDTPKKDSVATTSKMDTHDYGHESTGSRQKKHGSKKHKGKRK